MVNGQFGTMTVTENADSSITVLWEGFSVAGALVMSHSFTVPAATLASKAPVADTTAPTITSAGTFSTPENQAFTRTATANEAVKWAKGGTDAAIVTLNSSTGVWSVPAQDFETKASVVFTLTAMDAAGNVSAPQTVTVTITDVAETGGFTATGKSVIVDHTTDANTTPTGYSRWSLTNAKTLTPLLLSNGAESGWTGIVTPSNADVRAGGATDGTSTGNNSGVFLDAAMLSTWTAITSKIITVEYSGLDDAKAYDITEFGSRSSTGRSTKWTINGVSIIVDVSSNTSRVALFEKVRPSGGKIIVDFTAGLLASNDTAYHGITKIVEYAL